MGDFLILHANGIVGMYVCMYVCVYIYMAISISGPSNFQFFPSFIVWPRKTPTPSVGVFHFNVLSSFSYFLSFPLPLGFLKPKSGPLNEVIAGGN